MSQYQFANTETPGGYKIGEVTSALQKCVRRGDEDGALFWATEIDVAGYGNYAWKRLRIMASEDIGVADPHVATAVRALYENWCEQRKNKDDKSGADRLFLIQAVIMCARARKSRMVDNALMFFYEGDRPTRPIPDVALDKHTAAGRQMGRGHDHFFEEGAKLINWDGSGLDPDPYAESGPDARRNKPNPRAGASSTVVTTRQTLLDA